MSARLTLFLDMPAIALATGERPDRTDEMHGAFTASINSRRLVTQVKTIFSLLNKS